MRRALLRTYAVHVVQGQHPEIDVLGAERRNTAFEQAPDGVAHIELHHPPGGTGRGEGVEMADIAERRADASACGIQMKRHAWCKDAVEEALEYGREVEPPLGKDEDQPVGGLQPFDDRIDGARITPRLEIGLTLAGRKARIEILAIQVEQVGCMALLAERFDHKSRHRGSKAVR